MNFEFWTPIDTYSAGLADALLRKRRARPMVLGGFAVHAGDVLDRLAGNGRGKPIEEPHAVRLPRVEPVQHMRTPAVVQCTLCQNGVIIPADDAFVVTPAGVGAEVGDAGANIDVRLAQLCGNVGLFFRRSAA